MKKLFIALLCAAVVVGIVGIANAEVLSTSIRIISNGYGAMPANERTVIVNDPAFVRDASGNAPTMLIYGTSTPIVGFYYTALNVPDGQVQVNVSEAATYARSFRYLLFRPAR